MESIESTLDSGDLILVNRPCFSLEIREAVLCKGLKVLTNSKWDHIGLVVRGKNNELHILHVSSKQVEIVPIEQFLLEITQYNDNDDTIVVARKLDIPRTPSFHESLWEFVKSVEGIPRDNNAQHLINAAISCRTQKRRQEIQAKLFANTNVQQALAESLENDHLTPFQKRTLLSEFWKLRDEEKQLNQALERNTKHGLFENPESENLSSIYSAQLIALAYQHLDLLPPCPPSNSYTPQNFSSNTLIPLLMTRGTLSQEVQIQCNQYIHKIQTEVVGKTDEVKQKLQISVRDKIMITAALRKSFLMSSLMALYQDHIPWNEILHLLELVELKAGETIYQQGDIVNNAFFIVSSGNLEKFRIPRGDESKSSPSNEQKPTKLNHAVHIASFSRSHTFGEASFKGKKQRETTVICKDECKIWKLKRSSLEEFIQNSADLYAFNESLNPNQGLHSYSSLYTNGIDNQLVRPKEAKEAKASYFRLRNILSNHFLFLGMQNMESALTHFFEIKIPAGEQIFAQGDAGNNMYIIKEGTVERLLKHPEQTDFVRISTMEEGQSFGELSLMYESPRGSTVRAKTDCTLWALSSESFQALQLARGSNAIQQVFKTFASVYIDGQYFMTPEDFLRSIDRLPSDINHNDISESIRDGKLRRSMSKRSKELILRLADASESQLIDFWEFLRFDILMNQPQAEAQAVFMLIDRNKDGIVSRKELDQFFDWYRDTVMKEYWGSKQGSKDDFSILWNLEQREMMLNQIFGLVSDEQINYEQFLKLVDQSVIPKQLFVDMRRLSKKWEHSAFSADNDEITLLPKTSNHASMTTERHIFGVSLAVIASRTITAPLDRLKLLSQGTAPGRTHFFRYNTIIQSWKLMAKESGWRSLFNGNLVNILRIVPFTVVHMTFFEAGKHYFAFEQEYPTPEWVVVAGGLAGVTATLVTYPLDFIRMRIVVQRLNNDTFRLPKGKTHHDIRMYSDFRNFSYGGFGQCLVNIIEKEGIRGIYRGISPTILGVFVYTGFNFALYDTMLPLVPVNHEDRQPLFIGALQCGVLASRVSQLIAYPFDTVRRRMQVDCGADGTTLSTFKHIWKEEGFRGLYRGLTPNLAKILPSVATSLLVYGAVTGGRLTRDV